MSTFQGSVRRHAREIVHVPRRPIPWAWMMVTGLATLIPLALGVLRGEGTLAIFGALTGYFIGLTDHAGTFRHRVLMATVTSLVCWLAFLAGILLQNHLVLFCLLSAIMVYLLGIMGGRGAELERLLVLGGISFFVARYAPVLTLKIVPAISAYFAMAWLTSIGVIGLTRLTIQKSAGEYVRIDRAARNLLTTERTRHFYALTYMSAVLISILAVGLLDIGRGYWTVITVLLMMNPVRKTTYYRVAQRIVGTLLGVTLGHAFLLLHPPIFVYVGLAGAFAALVPLFWHRNYWLVSFCATLMVLAFLSVAQYAHIDLGLSLLRIKATLDGCLIAAVVTFVFRAFERALFPPTAHDETLEAPRLD
jgi:Fusaric acid resistance protein-like